MGISLFVSYSHLDHGWMQVFCKHLRGMLADRCRVWTDEDIPVGSTWEGMLRGQMRHAGAALVLASPDYLVSTWCRRELAALRAAINDGSLARVHWVQLRPCGWTFSELAELQAVNEPANVSLEDYPVGLERESLVLQGCRRIAESMLRMDSPKQQALASVRDLLSQSHEGAKYRPLVVLDRGDFSIVCRGLDENGDDVAIKIITNTPLHKLRALFLRTSQSRLRVADESVVKVNKVFEVGSDFDARVVIVSEMAPKTTLANLIQKHDALLNPQDIGTILRRLAEALVELHNLPNLERESEADEGYIHVMGPMPPSNVYYNERTNRPQISLVGVTNFLWHFFDPKTFRQIVSPATGIYEAPEQKTQRAEIDQRVDQYFLGMLALELLEGEFVFHQPSQAAPVDPQERLEESDKPWKHHEQFVELLRRLLKPKPEHRFKDMQRVLTELRALEEPERVRAKYSFRQWVQPKSTGTEGSKEFSKLFYQRFFDHVGVQDMFAAARERRHGSVDAKQEAVDDAHHGKLIDSLKAVLNYRLGNKPSSIDSLLPFHVPLGLEQRHFDAFTQSFIETLELRMRGIPRGEQEAYVTAWHTLFAPVIEEMLATKRDDGVG